jgi:hypothetical protein
MLEQVEILPAHRLRGECRYFGIQTNGLSRMDMIYELKNRGLTEVDTRFDPKPPKIDTSDRSDDLSNVFIGNGAGLHEQRSNQLYIANNDTNDPLIHGDFKEKSVHISNVLQIQSSSFEADMKGEEGDLRREGAYLYMYRSSNVEPGWYPLSFGIIKLV